MCKKYQLLQAKIEEIVQATRRTNGEPQFSCIAQQIIKKPSSFYQKKDTINTTKVIGKIRKAHLEQHKKGLMP